jgi:hypothetical protein
VLLDRRAYDAKTAAGHYGPVRTLDGLAAVAAEPRFIEHRHFYVYSQGLDGSTKGDEDLSEARFSL